MFDHYMKNKKLYLGITALVAGAILTGVNRTREINPLYWHDMNNDGVKDAIIAQKVPFFEGCTTVKEKSVRLREYISGKSPTDPNALAVGYVDGKDTYIKKDTWICNSPFESLNITFSDSTKNKSPKITVRDINRDGYLEVVHVSRKDVEYSYSTQVFDSRSNLVSNHDLFKILNK